MTEFNSIEFNLGHRASDGRIGIDISTLNKTQASRTSRDQAGIELQRFSSPIRACAQNKQDTDRKSKEIHPKVDNVQQGFIRTNGNPMDFNRYNLKTSERILSKSFMSNRFQFRQLYSNDFIKTIETCKNLLNKPGVHSVPVMIAAGFRYTNVKDTARCDNCQLEISGWTLDMNPSSIHSERSPDCTFVRALRPPNVVTNLYPSSSGTTVPSRTTSELREQDESFDSPIIDISDQRAHRNKFVEIEILKQVRRRTFSHWRYGNALFRIKMIAAGFFHANVEDRVICLYCNLICHKWKVNEDDPWDVHKILSPKCPFVANTLEYRESTSIMVVNNTFSGHCPSAETVTDIFPSDAAVPTTARHPSYMEISKRYSSFANWPNEALPAVDDLVRAGFFYTGKKTVVTCFYCNGSLQNWCANDSPGVEHARWFLNCPYARQVCGDDLYERIQEEKRGGEGICS